MRDVSLLLAICCCLAAASVTWSVPQTALPNERPEPFGPARVGGARPREGARLNISVGSVDTIGGTTYDWFTSGPISRLLVDSRHGGIHAVWMHSYSTIDTGFPDRNMRYQFYDSNTHAWSWIDQDYMHSGINVFDRRTGYGNIDIDTGGVVVVSAHHWTDTGIAPIVARDYAVGSGIFVFSPGEPELDEYEWPYLAVSRNNYYHLAMIEGVDQYHLYRSRLAAGGWEPPDSIAAPLFPTQNIAASKVPGSNKVCITWVVTPSVGYRQDSGYYCETHDAGETWESPVSIGFPPAFHPESDTLPSFYVTSLFPFYDVDDRLNIVADVQPYVHDTSYVCPSEIWHFCPENSPEWNRIQRASCAPGNLQGSVGMSAAYACRPSIGQDDIGDFLVTWEQFDSANVESTSMRLRADIWAAGSSDGGVTWSNPRKLTTPSTVSCRYPSICDRAWPGDSLAVLYLVDLCAGTGVDVFEEGPLTENPVVVQKVPVESIMQRGRFCGWLRSPNGGEALCGGDTFAVKWRVAPVTFDHGVLSLSTDGGSTFPTVIKASLAPADTVALWSPVPAVNCTLCRVRFEAKDSLGATVFSDMSNGNFRIDSVLSGASEERAKLPRRVRLLGPAPNPFARTTTVRLELPGDLSVEVAVYNTAGQKVRSFASGAGHAGVQSLVWDGTDERRRRVQAGVYYLRLSAGGAGFARKLVIAE